MQINPREYFVIARGLQDPTDLTTYYVRAVIRNAKTDAVIDTVNLTDNGSRRFTKQWQAPADVSGDGLYILVTISVYTDSAYSVRAENYGDSFEEHLVQVRLTPALMSGGGGDSPDIDYKKIQKMIDEAVGKIVIPKPANPVSLAGVEKQLSVVLSAVRSITLPDNSKEIMSSVVSNLASLHKSLSQLISERPKFEKTDISPVLSQLDEIMTKVDSMDAGNQKQQLEQMLERIRTFFDTDITDIKTEVQSIKDYVDKMPVVTIQNRADMAGLKESTPNETPKE